MNESNQKVTVTDIDMPFGSMIIFMAKWAIASIPAFTILLLVYRSVIVYEYHLFYLGFWYGVFGEIFGF